MFGSSSLKAKLCPSRIIDVNSVSSAFIVLSIFFISVMKFFICHLMKLIAFNSISSSFAILFASSVVSSSPQVVSEPSMYRIMTVLSLVMTVGVDGNRIL